MIAFDIETSGTNGLVSGIVALGAVDLDDVGREFYEESRLDEGDIIFSGYPGTNIMHPSAINGISPKDMRDPRKISQRELMEKFNYWMIPSQERILLAQNAGSFDVRHLFNKADKYQTSTNSDYHTIDLHTIAQTVYARKNGRLFVEKSLSKMKLKEISSRCGLGEAYSDITKERKALQDAKLTGECANRLLYGKNLFPEFSQYKIPEELMK